MSCGTVIINIFTFRVEKNFSEVAVKTLDNLFQCKFEQVPLALWIDDVFLSLSLKAKNLKLCMKTYGTRAIKNGTHILRKCLNELKSECLKSKFIVIKTIRLSIDRIIPIMEKYKNMKIIHLIRDPRSTISSQMRFMRGITKKQKPGIAEKMCTRILTDIEDYKILQYKYPSRVNRVRYESLACDPVDISRRLYKFCGMNFTEKVIQRIRDLTENSKEQKGVMNIVKSDSCATAYSRLKSIFNISVLEMNSCHYLLRKLNLKPFTDIAETI